MKKNKHKRKVKIARRLRTREDILEHKPIFGTENWENRKKEIKQRVKRQIEK